MYQPRHFKMTDTARMHELVQRYPLSLMMVVVEGEVQANPVPVLLDPRPPPDGRLRFHLALGNPLAAWLDGERQALLVFSGENHYISPDWYRAEQRVPTWNFATVQARGIPQALDDTGLISLLSDLSAAHEQTLAPKKPWTNDKLDAAHFTRLRRAIRGYQMPIDSLQGKWKMNQNRGPEDRHGVIGALNALRDDPGARQLAITMRKLTD